MEMRRMHAQGGLLAWRDHLQKGEHPMSTTDNKTFMPLQPTPAERWRERLHLAGMGVLSGLVVGLVSGVGARLIMRLIALEIGNVPVFTWATLNLLGVGFS